MRNETQENLELCLVLFTEGSITFVQAYVTLGGKTEKEDWWCWHGLTDTHLCGAVLAWEQTPLFPWAVGSGQAWACLIWMDKIPQQREALGRDGLPTLLSGAEWCTCITPVWQDTNSSVNTQSTTVSPTTLPFAAWERLTVTVQIPSCGLLGL